MRVDFYLLPITTKKNREWEWVQSCELITNALFLFSFVVILKTNLLFYWLAQFSPPNHENIPSLERNQYLKLKSFIMYIRYQV
jgi:hypothetical protein